MDENQSQQIQQILITGWTHISPDRSFQYHLWAGRKPNTEAREVATRQHYSPCWLKQLFPHSAQKKSVSTQGQFSESHLSHECVWALGFTPALCLTGILSELSLRDRLFYTLGVETKLHVIDRDASLQPHWPGEWPPPNPSVQLPHPYDYFFSTLHSFPSIFLLKEKYNHLLLVYFSK